MDQVRELNVNELQAEHAEWVGRNFPNQVSHHGLLGMVEEIGELSHAHLKKEQGIRGDSTEHDLAIEDAIGDIFIFALSYCNTNGIVLSECINNAWDEVKARDWINNRDDGTVPAT